jgi:hypothetical protein
VRSRISNSSDGVYWPAFADVMTVLVVVLLCMFAAVNHQQDASSTKNHEDSDKNSPTGGTDLPSKTREEFKSVVLADRLQCVLKQRRDLGVVSNTSLQLTLCTYPSSSKLPESEDACLDNLKVVNNRLMARPTLESIENDLSLQVRSLSLQVNAGLQSEYGEILRKRIVQPQEYRDVLNGGALRSFPLVSKYEAQGNSNRSSMALVITMSLNPEVNDKIDAYWKSDQAQLLQSLRTKSRSCEGIER